MIETITCWNAVPIFWSGGLWGADDIWSSDLLHLMVGRVGPRAHPVAGTPVPESIIGIHDLSKL